MLGACDYVFLFTTPVIMRRATMKPLKSMILASTLVLCGTAAADVTVGLVAHYSFDDCTANDLTNHGYNGVIKGGFSCEDGVGTNPVNKGLKLNGVDGHIDIDIPMDSSADWSICSQLRIAKIDSSYNDWQAIARGVSTAGESIMELGFKTSSRSLQIYPDLAAKSGTATANKDMSLCFTKKADVLSIYKNNVKIASGTGSPDFNILKTIGMWEADSTNPDDQEAFNGLIDDFRVYNRALSALEISQLYRTPLDVGGIIYGYDTFSVKCTNKSTGQTVTIDKNNMSYNCETSKLVVNPGDIVDVSISGAAH